MLAISTTTSAAITGTWKAEFGTQIGVQKYTFTLKQDGEKREVWRNDRYLLAQQPFR